MKRIITCLLILTVVLQACKKDDFLDPSQRGIGAAIYFSGEVDGETVVFEAGKNGYFQGHTWATVGTPPLPVWGSHFASSNSVDDGVSFFMINQSTTVDVNRQRDLEKTLVVGNKNFTKPNDIKENEVFITYRQNAFTYESALIDQNNFSFTIDAVKDTVYENREFIIATMSFDALLYSSFNQDTIEIRNGKTRIAYLATK
jgi:hypothetical protein